MRIVLTILLCFAFCASYGQQTSPAGGAGSATTNNLFNGMVSGKYLRVFGDTASARVFWNKFANPHTVDTGTLVIQGGRLFLFYDGANWQTPASSSGVSLSQMNDSLALKVYLKDSTTKWVTVNQLNDSLNNVVWVSDSNYFYLTPWKLARTYIAKSDTNTYSATRAYVNAHSSNFDTTAIYSVIATKVNKIDSNIFGGYITIPYYNSHLPANIDTTSLSNRINQRVKYTDTVGMSNRINAKMGYSDTASLSGRIDQRVKYTDSGTVYYSKYGVDTAKSRLTTAINTKLNITDTTQLHTQITQKLFITDTIPLHTLAAQKIPYSDTSIGYFVTRKVLNNLNYLTTAVTSLTASTGILGGTVTSTGTFQIDSSVVCKWNDTAVGQKRLTTWKDLRDSCTAIRASSGGGGSGSVTSVIAGPFIAVTGTASVTPRVTLAAAVTYTITAASSVTMTPTVCPDSMGTDQVLNPTSNTTLTIDKANIMQGRTYYLSIYQPAAGGPYSITFNNSTDYYIQNGTNSTNVLPTSTIASAWDMYKIEKHDGKIVVTCLWNLKH